MRIPKFELEDRLLKARTSSGFSQEELAEKIGLSRSSLNRYENGQRVPSDEVISSIAKTTGVSVEWLKTGLEPSQIIQSAVIKWTERGIEIDKAEG